MGNTLWKIIGGVILFIITVSIQRTYFSDKPEIVYTLSNEIYNSLLDDDDDRQVFQQLTIKNIGSKAGERIVVYLSEPVIDYDIRKYSDIDSVKIVSTKSKFELIYPLLPPGGQIEILFKNVKTGVAKSSLEVKHNSGLGKEIFSENKQSKWFVVFFIPFIFWIVISIWNFYDLYKNSFITIVKYEPLEKILKRSKPLLLSNAQWHEFRREAILNIFERDRVYSKLNELASWKILSSTERPVYLSIDEWNDLLKGAIENFKEKFANSVVTRSYLKWDDELFNIAKPIHLPASDWKEILGFINNYFLFYTVSIEKPYYTSDFSTALSLKKPDLIEVEVYERRKSILQRFYFVKAMSGLIKSKSLDSTYDVIDISLLNDSQREEIERIRLEIEKLKSADQFLVKIREVVNAKLTNSDNDLIDARDLEELNDLQKRIAEILESKDQVRYERNKFHQLRERVERQLYLIDRILSDPNYVSKIEDYGDIFNTGNFDNLKRVSDALKRFGS